MTRVSFIVAAHNAEKTIIELIESLQNVATTDDEIVVCDDCSQDRTWDHLAAYKSKIPMKIIRNASNCGRASSRNTAIQASAGEYVAVFDSDDLALPNALEPLRLLESDQKFVMASSQTLFHSKRFGYWILSKYPTDPAEVKNQFSVGKSPMSHGGTIIRRQILENSGLYNPAYVRAQDFDLLRRISSLGEANNLPSFGYLYNHDIWLNYKYWRHTKQSRNLILNRLEQNKINRIMWFGSNCKRVLIALLSKREASNVAREIGLI